MANYASVKAIVMDVEGTTTSISFVKETLFPYVRKNLKDFIEKHWEEPEFKKLVESLKEQALKDKESAVEGLVAIDDANEKETVEKNVLWLMDHDRKTSSLKELQGQIWRDAYKLGEIKGHLFADVAEGLRDWSAASRRLFIYSSGSVEAQKLLFKHSEAGDLVELFAGHFDTAVGAKTDAESYRAIAKEIGNNGEEILFLTDVPAEGKAAREAGMQVILVVREGNAPLTEADTSDFTTASSFSEIVMEPSAKRAKVDTTPADEEKAEPTTTMEVEAAEPQAPEQTPMESDEGTEKVEVSTSADAKVDASESGAVEASEVVATEEATPKVPETKSAETIESTSTQASEALATEAPESTTLEDPEPAATTSETKMEATESEAAEAAPKEVTPEVKVSSTPEVTEAVTATSTETNNEAAEKVPEADKSTEATDTKADESLPHSTNGTETMPEEINGKETSENGVAEKENGVSNGTKQNGESDEEPKLNGSAAAEEAAITVKKVEEPTESPPPAAAAEVSAE